MPCKPAATAKTAGHPRLTPARSFRDDITVVGAGTWTRREARMVSEDAGAASAVSAARQAERARPVEPGKAM